MRLHHNEGSALQFASYSPIHTLPHTYAYKEQLGVQCLAQGHFEMWTGGAGDMLSHSSI